MLEILFASIKVVLILARVVTAIAAPKKLSINWVLTLTTFGLCGPIQWKTWFCAAFCFGTVCFEQLVFRRNLSNTSVSELSVYEYIGSAICTSASANTSKCTRLPAPPFRVASPSLCIQQKCVILRGWITWVARSMSVRGRCAVTYASVRMKPYFNI